MNEWQRRELEQLRKENAWLDELSPFMKLVDNTLTFCLLYFFACLVGFLIGLGIGVML
jgi:hypothetical protein